MMQIPAPIRWGDDYFGRDAQVRARDLLWEHLSDQQRGEYAAFGAFIAVGNETGQKYWINEEGELRRESDRADFCLHIHCRQADVLPMEDQMLAKKIIIENDEDLFLRTANYRGVFPLRRSDGSWDPRAC
jgi:hypothetical protein